MRDEKYLKTSQNGTKMYHSHRSVQLKIKHIFYNYTFNWFVPLNC